ncbi:MAG TPA: hypothetical protein VF198_18045 [Vicinamibacterales bacterium]
MAEQDGRRRRGGQELPDEAQDRPEQNRGYDKAVRGGVPLPEPDDTDPLPDEPRPADSTGEEAARRAAADVRRRERRSR